VSSRRQGLLRRFDVPPGLFRRGLNLWPPFRGAGIRVTHVSADYREVDVALKLGLLNRNYFGTQFGGSLYAMTDPLSPAAVPSTRASGSTRPTSPRRATSPRRGRSTSRRFAWTSSTRAAT
jgi:hypothetical protein